MIRRSSLPVLSFGAGGGLADGVESLPDIESRLLFVDKGDNLLPDGSRQEPFHTVAAALAAAAALAPTANSRVTILVYPGEYNESGLTSVAHTSLIGVGGRDAVRIEGAAGVVLTVTHGSFRVWNLTIAQSVNARMVQVDAADGPTCEFRNCVFDSMGGDSRAVSFIAVNARGSFTECSWVNSLYVYSQVLNQGLGLGHEITLRRCTIRGQIVVYQASLLLVDGCTITGAVSHAFGFAIPSFTVKDCNITYTYAAAAIVLNASLTGARIVNNRIAAAVGQFDIGAAAATSGHVIAGNQMTRGIEGTVSHVASERRVGSAGMLDFYPTLQAALDSCTFDKIVVKLEEDVTLTAAATPPARPVTVDGQGHTITRGAGAAAFTSGNSLTLRNARVVGSIDVTAGSPIIEDCDITGMVDAQGASTAEIRRTEIVGDGTDGYAIRLGHSDAEVTVHHSWLEGHGDGESAVYWATDNDNLKLDYTTILHGWGCANDPFARAAAETPDFASHHCTFNVEPDIAVWTDIIAPAQRNNTYVGVLVAECVFPFTYVATLDEVLDDEIIPAVGGLSAVKCAWGAGDGNAPRIWLGAYNAANVLTLAGAPTAEDTPWQDSAGNRIQAERYNSASRRETTTVAVDPGDLEDIVVVLLANFTAATAGMSLVSTLRLAPDIRGIEVLEAGGRWYMRHWNGVIGTNSQIVGFSKAQTPFFGIIQRGGNQHAWAANAVHTQPTAAGSFASARGLSLGGRFANEWNGSCACVVLAYGVGIAAPFLASTYARPKRISDRFTGVAPQSGGSVQAFTRASAASWQDALGRHHLASSGLPRAGDSRGLHAATSRTNICPNNQNPSAQTGWQLTAGVWSNPDDSVALAACAEPAEAWGPKVHQVANATGNPVYFYGDIATGSTDLRGLQVLARLVAGAGGRIGWYEPGTSTFTSEGNLTAAYVPTRFHGLTPPSATCRPCVEIPDGATIAMVAHDSQAGARNTTIIPNTSTSAAAVRAAEVFDPGFSPVDSCGEADLTAAPDMWSDGEVGEVEILDRVTGSGKLIYASAVSGWATHDGTTEIVESTVPPADDVEQAIKLNWGGGRSLAVDGDVTTGAFDGALQGSGGFRIAPNNAEVRLKDFRSRKKGSP